jgi:hypothetical protein
MSTKKMRIIGPTTNVGRLVVRRQPSSLAVVRSTSAPRLAKRAERRRLKDLELRGEVKLGTGKIPSSFWDMAKPSDPGGSVRKALGEDRR